MSDETSLDALDAARAREYALLTVLLLQAPDAGLLKNLSLLSGDASPLGAAHAGLAAAARATTPERVAREFSELFVGLGRGELLPYGSYYLSGFLNERPLARLRRDLIALGIERAPGQTELEDHVAVLCEIMAQIIGRAFPAPPEAGRSIFDAHIRPWISRFFKDLEEAKTSEFYRSVGTLGRVFIEIETEAFALPT